MVALLHRSAGVVHADHHVGRFRVQDRPGERLLSVHDLGNTSSDGIFLLHAYRARLEFPQLKQKVRDFATEWKPSAILVEDKASGQSLIQELQRETNVPIIPVKVDKDKITRAAAVTPLIEAGKVLRDGSTTTWTSSPRSLRPRTMTTSTRRRRRCTESFTRAFPTPASLSGCDTQPRNARRRRSTRSRHLPDLLLGARR
jgi:predicted phage terminase large subunit-like protein